MTGFLLRDMKCRIMPNDTRIDVALEFNEAPTDCNTTCRGGSVQQQQAWVAISVASIFGCWLPMMVSHLCAGTWCWHRQPGAAHSSFLLILYAHNKKRLAAISRANENLTRIGTANIYTHTLAATCSAENDYRCWSSECWPCCDPQ